MPAHTTQHDVEWILTLFGTAVGAGILFLPIQAGLGGIWPIIILSCVCFPAVWLSHRTLTHVVVTHPQPDELPQMIEDDLGSAAGMAVNLLYLIFYLGLVVAYATGMINIVSVYTENQLGMEAIPRPILSLLITLGLTALMLTAGEKTILRITSAVAFPLIFALLFLSLYLIPLWNLAMFSLKPDLRELGISLLLIVPILLFSMDFSAVCALLAASYRRHYPDVRMAMRRSDRAVYWNCLLLLVFVMFFVLSCVLATSRDELAFALRHNIDILTLLSLHIHPPLLRYLFPLLAFATILHSYFVMFLGARSRMAALLGSCPVFNRWRNASTAGPHTFEWVTPLISTLPLLVLADMNPSILAIIGMLAAPIIALICYVMPVCLFRRVPRLAVFREHTSALVLVTGLLVMVSFTLGTLL